MLFPASPVAGQAITPPSSCFSGWREFVEVSRSANNTATTGNDYGSNSLFPVDNYFQSPSGQFLVAVQEISRRNPYSPQVYVYGDSAVDAAVDLAGTGTFSYALVDPPSGTLRVQSQFVRYRIWYCLVAVPTPTPTPSPTPSPTPTLPPTSTPTQSPSGGTGSVLLCLPPPMPTSTPPSTPGTGAAAGAFTWPGLGSTPSPTPLPPLPTTCVPVVAPSPVVPTPVGPVAINTPVALDPVTRPIEFGGGLVYRECYDIWPGFEIALPVVGTWTAPAFGVCVSYFDFSIAYDGVDLADYLIPAVSFAAALIMFYFYRKG